MDDNSLEQRILRKVESFNHRLNSSKKFTSIKKIVLTLMVLSPAWLPILFTNLGASIGCCKSNKYGESELGLWFFGVGPVIISLFLGIWGLCKFKVHLLFITLYALIWIFLLFFIGWWSLLTLGAGP